MKALKIFTTSILLIIFCEQAVFGGYALFSQRKLLLEEKLKNSVGYSKSDNVKIYEKPTGTSKVLGTANKGAKFKIIKDIKGWYEIENPLGSASAFILKKNVKTDYEELKQMLERLNKELENITPKFSGLG